MGQGFWAIHILIKNYFRCLVSDTSRRMKVLSNICFLASCSSCFGLDNVGHCLLDCDSGRKTNNTRKQRSITKNHTTQLQHDWMIELNPNPFGFGVPQWKMEDLPKKFLRLPIWLPPFCSCPSQGDPWCMDAWSAALQVEEKNVKTCYRWL